MTYQTPVKDFFLSQGLDVDLCLSPLYSSDGNSDPIFFYHVAKAGGVAVHMALMTTIKVKSALLKTNLGYCRYHAYDPEEDKAAFYAGDQEAISFVGIIGEETFGEHRKYSKDRMKLATVLREPFDRLVSHFFYYRRRNGLFTEPTELEFMAFVNDPVNRNFQCQILAERASFGAPVDELLQVAQSNLDQFTFASTLDRIEELLIHIWSYKGFPMFLSQRLHANPHKSVSFNHLKDDVLEINQADCKLVAQLEEAPIFPIDLSTCNTSEVRLPELTGIAIDRQKNEQFSGMSAAIPTAELLSSVQSKRLQSLNDLEFNFLSMNTIPA